jgi:acetoin utilization protein AcuA
MRIELLDAPAALDGVTIADDFGAILRGTRLLETMRANLSAGAIIAAALDEGILRGYATVIDVAPAWRRFAGIPDVTELGAIEVARSSRRRGIGDALLARLRAVPALDDVVTITYGASGHWEPELGGLTPRSYRLMLVRLLGRSGFIVHETDDPDLRGEPLSFLAARFGKSAPPRALLDFMSRLYEAPALVEPTA